MEPPKVRFTKSSLVMDQEKVEVDKDVKDKIKIKSIEPVNYPLKVSKSGRHIVIKDARENQENAKESPIEIDLCKLSISSKPLSSTSNAYIDQYTQAHDNTNNDCDVKFQMPENNTDKNNLVYKKSDIFGSSDIKHNNDHSPSLSSSNDNSDHGVQIIKDLKNSTKSKVSDKNIEDVSLVNKNTNLKNSKSNSTAFNKARNISRCELPKASEAENKENCSKSFESSKDKKNSLPPDVPNILKDTTNPKSSCISKNVAKKTINIKKLQVMPCAKFKTTSQSLNKTSKKITQASGYKKSLFNITGSNTKISVKAAPLCEKSIADCEQSKLSQRKSIASNDLLSHPEYNSTISVIKKLKTLEKEKVIPDYENLPPNYKNFINGKVSAALDFPPCESVYKNLINISVENDQLPIRLMRSKDPEPRDKDIVPKLSDFYNPKCTEQFLMVATPIVKEPVNVNTLNSFKISKKICVWKKHRDSNI